MNSSKYAALAVAALLATAATAKAQTATTGSPTTGRSIVAVATQNGSFNTLVTALKAANLVSALEGAGPFTVFAPTDAAFAALPPGTLDALLKDPAKLASVLTYHVVSGKVMAADVIQGNGARPATLNGATLDIQVRAGRVYVNGAVVTTADVSASNGVIHVIDAVVLPPAGN